MNYDREIYKVLVEAGEAGISLQKLSRHVHNACNSLFNPITREDVHAYVVQFIQRNSSGNNASIERMQQRGVYRLNSRSNQTSELMLQFSNHEEIIDVGPKETEDLSLTLPFE